MLKRARLHAMQLPREVIIGDGALPEVGQLYVRLGLKGPALVVTGPKTWQVAGRDVAAFLSEQGIAAYTLRVEKPTLEEVKHVEGAARAWGIRAVVGVGGGSKIDVAKLAASRLNVPMISVPTTASHDGISSPFASIKGLDRPYSVRAQAPVAVLVDMDIIVDSPPRLAASGCGDVIAKFTAVRDWRLAHELNSEYYGDYAASLSLMSARLVAKNARRIGSGSREGLRVLMEALISCGVAMSIAGSSRPCSGSEHLFSHALDVIRPDGALHGEQCGVGTIMMAKLHGLNWRKIRAVLATVGAPVDAEGISATPEQVVEALLRAPSIRPERFTILSQVKLDTRGAEELARSTRVIG
ncbi:NAD(P)-dependent glycerol-1-phosphate dehydrogenase [Candidatus Bathyarchaeota archaeon]|nr:MAG: NAD(P)-dependent glycerol-1-phosphate dehydrogenase [Candidatus Bathyarchaeota archaeon]